MVNNLIHLYCRNFDMDVEFIKLIAKAYLKYPCTDNIKSERVDSTHLQSQLCFLARMTR